MRDVCPVWVSGVGSRLEQFLYADEELRQYVVYTYYSKERDPLYIGCSKSFYHAHYFNSQRLPFFDEVKYLGFFFLESESEIRDAKKHFIRAREPKHNKIKERGTAFLPGLDSSADDFVVLRSEMEEFWEDLNR